MCFDVASPLHALSCVRVIYFAFRFGSGLVFGSPGPLAEAAIVVAPYAATFTVHSTLAAAWMQLLDTGHAPAHWRRVALLPIVLQSNSAIAVLFYSLYVAAASQLMWASLPGTLLHAACYALLARQLSTLIRKLDVARDSGLLLLLPCFRLPEWAGGSPAGLRFVLRVQRICLRYQALVTLAAYVDRGGFMRHFGAIQATFFGAEWLGVCAPLLHFDGFALGGPNGAPAPPVSHGVGRPEELLPPRFADDVVDDLVHGQPWDDSTGGHGVPCPLPRRLLAAGAA